MEESSQELNISQWPIPKWLRRIGSVRPEMASLKWGLAECRKTKRDEI
jgi:hypothetical protein